MQIVKGINRWFSKYKNSLLSYKDGFWEMPYLSNSPETIVTSIAKMPFTKHSKNKQFIASTTPLMKGGFFYEEVEPGFWIIPSHLKYKANVSYKKVNDKQISMDWYILSMTAFGAGQNKSVVDGIAYANCSWVLFKPGAGNINCHFKGAEEISITFYFHKDWVKERLYKRDKFLNSPLNDFFESDAQTNIWSDNVDVFKPYYEALYNNFYKLTTERRTQKDKEEVKNISYQMIDLYISMYSSLDINSNLFLLSEKNRKIIYKAEKIMLQNLTAPFPGIEKLSGELGTSETSLKANFKKVFNQTLFQFFQEKQMKLAYEVLMKNDIKITEFAISIGYENTSKFSSAFQKHNNILPSKVMSDKYKISN